MDDAAVPPPARRRSLRIPGLAAAPWALVALVIAWHLGYSARSDVVCAACRARVTEREAGFAVRWARIVALGRTRRATPDPHLVGIVDPACDHRGERAGENWQTVRWPRSPVTLAMAWWDEFRRGRRSLRQGPRSPSEFCVPVGATGLISGLQPKRHPAWSVADEFQVATFLQADFRAFLLESVSGGAATIEDVRWLLTIRDAQRLSVAPTDEERRRLELARMLLDRGASAGTSAAGR